MAKAPVARYGIAEWFGYDITKITPEKRQQLALIATKQDDSSDISNAPICPFFSELVPNSRCNKASGVCSIRRFSQNTNGFGAPIPNDKIVTVCPSRFIQKLDNGKSLFVWIAEKMLEINNPTVVKETPFLRKLTDSSTNIHSQNNNEEKTSKKAGRIDWILVNPETMNNGDLEWCAVETQALYFSGDKMRPEFDIYAAAPSQIQFPVGKRRPDYRSSGPKRLSPQLDVKVPVLRNWGKKVVVVIDKYFYNNMNTLAEAYPRARNDQERRDNADVVWFIVDYNDTMNLTPSEVIFTTLDSSRMALNATEPLSKADFNRNLKYVIEDQSRSNKVFKASE